MKTKEEIEQLSEQRFPTDNSDRFKNVDFSSLKIGFFEGYTQCQKDMAEKKYTEEDLHTILRLRKEWYSHTDKNVVRDFINSLNKQD
jgi:hypothetical protein